MCLPGYESDTKNDNYHCKWVRVLVYVYLSVFVEVKAYWRESSEFKMCISYVVRFYECESEVMCGKNISDAHANL